MGRGLAAVDELVADGDGVDRGPVVWGACGYEGLEAVGVVLEVVDACEDFHVVLAGGGRYGVGLVAVDAVDAHEGVVRLDAVDVGVDFVLGLAGAVAVVGAVGDAVGGAFLGVGFRLRRRLGLGLWFGGGFGFVGFWGLLELRQNLIFPVSSGFCAICEILTLLVASVTNLMGLPAPSTRENTVSIGPSLAITRGSAATWMLSRSTARRKAMDFIVGLPRLLLSKVEIVHSELGLSSKASKLPRTRPIE